MFGLSRVILAKQFFGQFAYVVVVVINVVVDEVFHELVEQGQVFRVRVKSTLSSLSGLRKGDDGFTT